MRNIVVLILVAGMTMISQRVSAGEKPSFEKGIFASESSSITAVVEKIDHQARTATLKGPQGGTVELTVNQSAKNFDQVQKGDHVTLSYYGELFLKLQKSGDATATAEASVMQSVPKGQKPKVVKVDTIDGMVTIESVDAKARTVTVRNAKGELKTHTIGESVADFEKLKVGDQIYYSYAQVVVLEVAKP
jgi:Cu/Ag efflux protein CusF